MPLSCLFERSTVPLASVALLAAFALPGPGTTAVAQPTRPALAPSVSTVAVAVPSAYDTAPFDQPRRLQVPTGWTVSVWARRTAPRLMAIAPDGRILVSRPESGKVTRLTPHGSQNPTSKTLLSKLRNPHGLAFDGLTLYVAESHRIDSYHYSKGKLGKRHTVLKGLPDAQTKGLSSYKHPLKSVAVGRDGELYVSVGSSGNASPADRTASPERAAILRVAKGEHTSTVFARGVRNGTGLAVAPDGAVWTAVNNRDNIAYPYHRDYDHNGSDDYKKVITAYVNDHPLEPFAHLTQGRDLGWPFCNPDRDDQPGVQGTFVRDAELNADGSKLDCTQLEPVEPGLPAHSAPLGLSFTRTDLPGLGAGALVGVHGSWNRTPPREPEVAFFSYRNGTLGAQHTILSGFQNDKGQRWGRPVAAVQGADGAVYVSDDLADAVYRLAPPV